MPDNPYREILSTLSSDGIDFIVGGGVACVLHGVERITMDVDLAVAMTPVNLGRFLRSMAKMGLAPRAPVPAEALLDATLVRAMVEEKHALVFTFLDPDRPIRQVDVFLRDDLSYSVLLPDTEILDLGGFSVRVLTKRKLYSLKLAICPPRAKDSIDLEYLQRHVT